MRAIVAIAVIFVLFVAVHSTDFIFNCAARSLAIEIAGCIARQAAGVSRNDTDFCNDCGNSLVSYYDQDCLNGAGVVAVQASK